MKKSTCRLMDSLIMRRSISTISIRFCMKELYNFWIASLIIKSKSSPLSRLLLHLLLKLRRKSWDRLSRCWLTSICRWVYSKGKIIIGHRIIPKPSKSSNIWRICTIKIENGKANLKSGASKSSTKKTRNIIAPSKNRTKWSRKPNSKKK